MDSAKAQLADKLKTANNILVTVSRNPSVDQLSALLGLTLALNKSGKHAAAVFSGEVPSNLEFLQPDATIEKNTNSLRDFIIALDKNKADKLRYKVEDNVVRIFITPYKTSLSDADLEFSQGDFNVDVVVALGVDQQEQLDEAITAHGRILHDATVTSITLNSSSEGLGTINWHDDQASSLCELVTELIQSLEGNLFDGQIATSLLTGIVAETERFSNEKTSSQTMSASAALMAAGANQQLVATKLDEPAAPQQAWHDDDANDESDDGGLPVEPDDTPPKPDDGTIEISHESEPETPEEPEPAFELPTPQPQLEEEPKAEANPPQSDMFSTSSRMVIQPPTMGGTLTANTTPEGLDPSTDPFGVNGAADDRILTRGGPAVTPDPAPTDDATAPPTDPVSAPTEAPAPVSEPEQPAELPETPAPEPEAPVQAPVWEPPQEQEQEQKPEQPEPQPEQPAEEPAPVESAPESEPELELDLPTEPTPPTPPAPSDDTPSEQPGPGPLAQAEPAGEPSIEKTLSELEASVANLKTEDEATPTDLNDARDEVSKALSSDTTEPAPTPIEALNAQPLGGSLHADDSASNPAFIGPSVEDILNPNHEQTAHEATGPQVTDSTAPPPVPPPIPFNFNPPQ